MDLFTKLGDELRGLFKDLFHPEKKAVILSKMQDILKAATLIGGAVAKEAESLQQDVTLYLKNPQDKKQIDALKKHAMRLEQETREI